MQKNDVPKRNGGSKGLLIWSLMFFTAYGLYSAFGKPPVEPEMVKASEFVDRVATGQILEVEFREDGHVVGQSSVKDAAPIETIAVSQAVRAEVLRSVIDKDIPYEEEPIPEFSWGNILLQALLFVILPLFLFIFFINRMMRSGTNQMNRLEQFMGKGIKEVNKEEKVPVRFSDVAGMDEVVAELNGIVKFLKDPKRFTSLGGRMPKGVLLMGPPGTGKTLLARALAGEAGVPFFSISGSNFVEVFVGVGASRTRTLFETVNKNAPAILFIDEIDAIGRSRGSGFGGGNDEREQTLNQILVSMDGFTANDGVFVIAATNRPDVLDEALIRPGRFDKQIVVPLPDLKGRLEILEVHARRIKMSADATLTNVAKATTGMTGAGLENVLNEAALLAGAAKKAAVEPADLDEAVEKMQMGPKRMGVVISTREKMLTAVHEAGHALTAWLTPGSFPVRKATIIPRGRALGVTISEPPEDLRNYTRSDCIRRIKMALGGRLAEELVYGELTTGAANDIEQLTVIARKMVCEWGMSEKLAPLNYGKGDGPVFMGRDLNNDRGYSEDTGRRIDEEIRAIVDTCQKEVRELLKDKENRKLFDALVAELVQHETLDNHAFERILGKQAPEPPFKALA